MLGLISKLCRSWNVDPNTSFLAVVAIILFWKFLRGDRTRELLSKLPGPKAYPIIGNLPCLLVPREKLFKANIERCKKYGAIFRIWLGSYPIVTVSDPEYVEEVLHSSKHLEKGFAYKFIEQFIGTGLITSSGEKWLSHRKILTPAFHFKILDSFFEVFREQGKILMEKLDEKASEGKEFDIYGYIKNCALDVICEAAMGVKVNSQTNTCSRYLQSVLGLSAIAIERTLKIWLHPDIVFNMTALGREHEKHLKVVHGFVNDVIRERRKLLQEKNFDDAAGSNGKRPRLAFLDLLLDTAAKNKSFTDDDIRQEVDTFMFAGHDTTTSAITWAVYLIGLHPEIQEDLYREQKRIFGDDMERPVYQEDLTKMSLLDRVMKESIRLYPSVPGISRTLDEDVKFGQYYVPKGTTAFVQIYALHRNPKVFPNPDKFDPDRFLPENMDKRHSFAFVPFSAGPRNCIGKRFALNEEKYMLACLIRRYKIQSMQKPEDLNLVGELILRPLSGIMVKLQIRDDVSTKA